MENTNISRVKAQQLLVEIMYSFIMHENNDLPINFEDTISDICKVPFEDCDFFIKIILLKAIKNQHKIVEYISKYLKNWNFHRLNITIQAILIISVTEYYYKGEDILKAIVIDNAVTLAKIYGDGGEKDYKFVNGILDNCLDNGKQNLLLD